jgi:antitoxin (DNA-binding transcriptional repressor) of toxin-antitoxin stability system
MTVEFDLGADAIFQEKESPKYATLTVEEDQRTLKDLSEKLAPGAEIVLTDKQQPVAKLVGERFPRTARPLPGLGKGSIVYMAPEFDEPLDEFKEYME